ncbi:MAG: hypothetical protein RIE31_00025 [Alphaproteobacteria bacterium]
MQRGTVILALALVALIGAGHGAGAQQSALPFTVDAMPRPADTVSQSTANGVSETLAHWDISDDSRAFFGTLRHARRDPAAAWPAALAASMANVEATFAAMPEPIEDLTTAYGVAALNTAAGMFAARRVTYDWTGFTCVQLSHADDSRYLRGTLCREGTLDDAAMQALIATISFP